MTLASWISAAGITDAECARRLRISRQALSRYKAHARVPRRDVMFRIVELTGGEVTAGSFFEQHAASDRTRPVPNAAQPAQEGAR